jgi:hypothetical protein
MRARVSVTELVLLRLMPRAGNLLASTRLPRPLPARASQSPLRDFIITSSNELPISCAAAEPSE